MAYKILKSTIEIGHNYYGLEYDSSRIMSTERNDDAMHLVER